MGKERQRCCYSRISHLGRRQHARKGASGRGGRRRGGGRLAGVWQERGRGGKATVASRLMFHFWWAAGGESVCGVLHLTHSFSPFHEQAAKILGKPDLVTTAWVKRLVTLCDKVLSMKIKVAKDVVERRFDEIFDFFQLMHVGCASIAQVRVYLLFLIIRSREF
jgi:hypothetical protein